MSCPLAAIVPGHTPDAPGAVNADTQISEWHYNCTLARMVTGQLDRARMMTRPLPNDLRGLATNINQSKVDFVVSMHLNAYNRQTTGCETWHCPGSEEGELLARELHDRLGGALDNEDRGVKAGSKYALLSETTVPAVICEPAFIDATRDFLRVQKQTCKLAAAYVAGIRSYRGQGVPA